MITLLLGYPVAASDAADWTVARKALAILWMSVIDIGVVMLIVNF